MYLATNRPPKKASSRHPKDFEKRIEELQVLAVDIEDQRREEVRRNQELEEKIKRLEDRERVLEVKRQEAEDKRHDLELVAAHWKAMYDEAESESESLCRKLEHKERRTNDRKEELQRQEAESVSLRNENEKLQKTNAGLDIRKVTLTQKVNDIGEERRILKDENTSLRRRETQLGEERKILKDENTSLRRRETLLGHEITQLGHEITQLSHENTKLKEEYGRRKQNEAVYTVRLKEEKERVDTLNVQNAKLLQDKAKLDRHVRDLQDTLLERDRQGPYRRREERPPRRFDDYY